ncbi:enoyl-CoA hydratase-related protein [Paenirhodobacter sp.]|uniref:enoyl-CoA hydratase-related protein n=1 Tax=Paenirhodobacter sp. TaxID=1965326 RepID=UPI003B426FEC
MEQRLRLERAGDLARVDFLGSAEGFDAALAEDLATALEAAFAMPDLRAVILSSPGWPVAEDPAEEPAQALLTLTARIAEAPVPVIAIADGLLSGAGLALMQAAALRVLRPSARLSVPEFALGLIPSGGVAVRLARRAGPYAAAEFLTSGRSLSAHQAQRLGICDAISEEVPTENAPPPALDPVRYLADLARFRGQIPPGPLAPVAHRLAEVLEAALLLPPNEAIAFEQVAREDLLGDELSAALRHVARARRQAARPAGALPRRIALWNQPDRLALGLLRAGCDLRLGASDPAALEASLRALSEALAAAKPRDAAWQRLEPVIAPGDLSPADLIIAAPTPEELPALRATGALLALEGVAPEGAELGLTRLPGVVEIHAAGETGLAPLAAALSAGRDLVLHAQGLDGWFEAAYITAAERVLMAGASPDAVDAALTGWGFAEGPFARLDRRGVDVVMARIGPPWRAGPYLNWLKMGRGVRWHGDRARPWADKEGELAALRREAGSATRALPAREIVASVLAELAQAGALALQAGRAHRVGDVDLLAIAALGLARHRGGPMFQADRTGLLALRKRLRHLESEGAPPPAELLDVLIRNGRRFSDLDAGGSRPG